MLCRSVQWLGRKSFQLWESRRSRQIPLNSGGSTTKTVQSDQVNVRCCCGQIIERKTFAMSVTLECPFLAGHFSTEFAAWPPEGRGDIGQLRRPKPENSAGSQETILSAKISQALPSKGRKKKPAWWVHSAQAGACWSARSAGQSVSVPAVWTDRRVGERAAVHPDVSHPNTSSGRTSCPQQHHR